MVLLRYSCQLHLIFVSCKVCPLIIIVIISYMLTLRVALCSLPHYLNSVWDLAIHTGTLCGISWNMRSVII